MEEKVAVKPKEHITCQYCKSYKKPKCTEKGIFTKRKNSCVAFKKR